MKINFLQVSGLFLLLMSLQTSIAFGSTGPLLGDVNLDGRVDLLDIEPFMNNIVNGHYHCNADTNVDGVVDLLDVAPLIEILNGTEISSIEPESIEGFQFAPSSVGGGDDFQFIIRFDNHEPNSITAFNSSYVSTFVRVRNTMTEEIIESHVITYSIHVIEDGEGEEQETIGLVNARMVIDWVFLTPEDFGPGGDYVVDFVRIALSSPSFKDSEGNNIVGTIKRTGF